MAKGNVKMLLSWQVHLKHWGDAAKKATLWPYWLPSLPLGFDKIRTSATNNRAVLVGSHSSIVLQALTHLTSVIREELTRRNRLSCPIFPCRVIGVTPLLQGIIHHSSACYAKIDNGPQKHFFNAALELGTDKSSDELKQHQELQQQQQQQQKTSSGLFCCPRVWWLQNKHSTRLNWSLTKQPLHAPMMETLRWTWPPIKRPPINWNNNTMLC